MYSTVGTLVCLFVSECQHPDGEELFSILKLAQGVQAHAALQKGSVENPTSKRGRPSSSSLYPSDVCFSCTNPAECKYTIQEGGSSDL